MRERMIVVTASLKRHYVANESMPPRNYMRQAACSPYVWGYEPDRVPKRWRTNRQGWRIANSPMCKLCEKRYGWLS